MIAILSPLFACLVTVALGHGETVTVNPSLAFYDFAKKFCSGGNVLSANIGDGDISAENSRSLSDVDYPHTLIVPAPNRTLSSCSEETNSCVSIGSSYFWCRFKERKCMSKYIVDEDSKYSNLQTRKSDNQWSFISYIDNYTNETQTQTFQKSETTIDTYSWTMSTEIDAGASFEIDVGVPGELGTKSVFKLDLKTSTSNTQTHTESQTWTVTQNVVVPPRTTVKVEMIVSAIRATADFSATMKLPYYAHVWCGDLTKGHREWFIPANNFMPQAYPKHCSGNTCKIGGAFRGLKGEESTVKLSSCKLGEHHNC